jgi:hypothetical protein
MPASHRVLRQMGRTLDRAATAAHRDFGLMGVQQIHDPPPSRAGAIFKMTFDAGVRALQSMVDLVGGLIDGIAFADGKLRALLEIQHERYCDARLAGPARIDAPSAVALEIPLREWMLRLWVHVGQSAVPAMRCRPTTRSHATSSTMVPARISVESAASVGSGASSMYCSILMGRVLVLTSVRKIETG